MQRLIGDGTAHMVVPGNPPTGCLPAILTLRQSPAAADYDRAGCLRGVNDVARHHNALLRAAVGGLRLRHPHARIVFADFYRPVYRILENPGRFGEQLALHCIYSSMLFSAISIDVELPETILRCTSAGFVVGDVLKACCGAGGGAYNWNGSAVCGMPGVAACGDPAAHVSWDGVPFTEAVSRYVAKGWLHGPYADPPILSAVPR